MATYMVTWQFSPEYRNETIARFMEGSAMEEPGGVTPHTRYHSVEGRRGWGAVEADDPKAIADWFLSWTDVLTFRVTPVVSDEELGELYTKHGHG